MIISEQTISELRELRGEFKFKDLLKKLRKNNDLINKLFNELQKKYVKIGLRRINYYIDFNNSSHAFSDKIIINPLHLHLRGSYKINERLIKGVIAHELSHALFMQRINMNLKCNKRILGLTINGLHELFSELLAKLIIGYYPQELLKKQVNKLLRDYKNKYNEEITINNIVTSLKKLINDCQKP